MKQLLLLLGIITVLFSCNSKKKESSEKEVTIIEHNSKTDDLSYDCLRAYKDDYKGLISKKEMAGIFPIDFDVAKEELRSGSYGEYSYNWPSDRPDLNLEISGTRIKTPDQNIMGIKSLSFYSEKSQLKSNLDNFNMGYKNLSQNEMDKIQKNLESEGDEVKKTGKDLMKVRAISIWEAVEGIGSSAWFKWNDNYGGELAVLAGKAKFIVVIKVSDNPDENKQLAKEFANRILSKCQGS